MYEFDSLSVSTFEASSLAAKLSERSEDGWDVVAIVPAGSELTAFLKRAKAAASGTADDSASTSVWDTSSSVSGASTTSPSNAPSEPAGWGTAPEQSSGGSSWGSSNVAPSGSVGSSSWSGESSAPSSGGGWGPSSSTQTPSAPASAPATPAVPAGWYADPANRYELRYWDGSAWTEHVSRAGQQYTDPPVA